MKEIYDIPISEFSFLRVGDEFIFARCPRRTGYYYICPGDIIGRGRSQGFQIFIKKTSFDLYYPYIRFSCTPVDKNQKRELFRHILDTHRVEPTKVDLVNPFPEFALCRTSTAFFPEELQPPEFWEQPDVKLDSEEEVIRELTVKIISRMLIPSSKVIDIACSTGTYLGRLINENHELKVIGCDISLPMCQTAGKKRIPVVCCDSVNLPVLPDTFDLVVCRFLNREVISLFAVTPILKECHRILKPGGKACFLGYTKPYVNADILEATGFDVGNRILTTKDGIIPFYIAEKRKRLSPVETSELFNSFPYHLVENLKELLIYDKDMEVGKITNSKA